MGKVRKAENNQTRRTPAALLAKAVLVGIIVVLNCVLFLPSLRYGFTGLGDMCRLKRNGLQPAATPLFKIRSLTRLSGTKGSARQGTASTSRLKKPRVKSTALWL